MKCCKASSRETSCYVDRRNLLLKRVLNVFHAVNIDSGSVHFSSVLNPSHYQSLFADDLVVLADSP